MTLAALMKKGGLTKAATSAPSAKEEFKPDANAIVANLANDDREEEGTTATTATFAFANAPKAETAYRWLIHFIDRDPVEVTFSPVVTHAEALAAYPAAVAAEPMADDPQLPESVEEASLDSHDDRRPCRTCGNLTPGGVCAVATPGGVVSANRGYRPVFPDHPQRCEGFAPKAGDNDQRPGRERWPGLIQKEVK